MILLLLLFLVGCGPVWSQAIHTAIETNNSLVAELNIVQDTARDQRKARLDRVATTASSVEVGKIEFDRIDAAYAPVWRALAAASLAQTALATVLEAAKIAEHPDIGEAMRLAGALQKYYLAVSRALAEVR